MSSNATHSSKKRKRDDENKKGSFVPVQGDVLVPAADLEDDEDIELVLIQIPSMMSLDQLSTLPITDKLFANRYSTSSSSSSSSSTPTVRIVTHPAEGETLQGLQLNVLLPSSSSGSSGSSSSSNKKSKDSSAPSSSSSSSNYRVCTRNFTKLLQIQQQLPSMTAATTLSTTKSKTSSSSVTSTLKLSNATIVQPVQLLRRNSVPQNSTLAYRYRPIGSHTPSTANGKNKEISSGKEKTRSRH